jgi:uncharacterized protein (DUF885 family)
MYRYAVRSSTTTDLTPEEIHELGLREVSACRRCTSPRRRKLVSTAR